MMRSFQSVEHTKDPCLVKARGNMPAAEYCKSGIERLVYRIVIRSVHPRRQADRLALVIGRRVGNAPGGRVSLCFR